MTDLNKWVGVGRLTRDSQLSYTPSGMAINQFSIAVNRSRKTENGFTDDTSFFDVKIFGKMAETLKQYLTKGQQVAVCGSLVQSRWEKDGLKHSKVEIIGESVQLVGGKAQSNEQGQQSQTQGQQYSGYDVGLNESVSTLSNGFSDDIPF